MSILIDPKSGHLRGVWRALVFAALIFLPDLLSSLLPATGEQVLPARIDVSWPMIITYAVLVGWALFASWFCLHWLERLPLSSLGLTFDRPWWREVLLGIAVSALMVALLIASWGIFGGLSISRGAGFEGGGVWREIGAALVFFALAGSFEELLMRGYAFQTLMRGLPAAVPLVVLAILFGFGHWGNPHRTMWSTANTVLAGIWLGVAYLRTRRLWFPAALHLGWNWMIGAFFGLPVSGLRIPAYALLETRAAAPDWVTGGVYGPEGGVAATLILILATLVIHFSGRGAQALVVGPDRRLTLE